MKLDELFPKRFERLEENSRSNRLSKLTIILEGHLLGDSPTTSCQEQKNSRTSS